MATDEGFGEVVCFCSWTRCGASGLLIVWRGVAWARAPYSSRSGDL